MMPDEILVVLFIVSRNSYFLIGPFLFFYTKSILSIDSFRSWHLLHLVPFFLSLIFSVFHRSTLIPFHELPEPGSLKGLPLSMVWIILSIFSRGFYSFLVFRLIHNHAGNVHNFYSRKTVRNTLSWLYYLVAFYFVLFFYNFLILIFPQSLLPLTIISTDFVRLVPSLLFIFLFSLFAQNQKVPEDKRVLKSDENIEISKVEAEKKEIKYRNSGLTSEESSHLYNHLCNYILESRIFLDPDLTLNTLAGNLSETRHHLSEAINRESGEKFYSFVNGFRLREFLSSLEENRYPHYTILSIAYECGFKSTSAFYDLFKKSTGMTPKDYMKNKKGIT
jgi:AraC-like DNA-binding protein